MPLASSSLRLPSSGHDARLLPWARLVLPPVHYCLCPLNHENDSKRRTAQQQCRKEPFRIPTRQQLDGQRKVWGSVALQPI